MITKRIGIVAGWVLAATVISTSANAGVPAGQDQLTIYPGDPQKNGESIISISGRWVTDDGLKTGFTALTFLNGPDRPKPDTAQSVAKKVAKSVKRGMAYLRVSLRGILVDLVKDDAKPHYTIKNKENITLSKITIRDFVNDKFTSEIVGKSFGQQGVKVSFDLAGSADVAKIVLNYSASDLKTFRAEGGGIEVSIGNGKAVTIETKNKTTEEIEKALASKLGGKFSSSPLFPDEREKRDKKNIKPFDGGEVHMDAISANSFTVEVKDKSLGIINRYKFRDSTGGDGGWW